MENVPIYQPDLSGNERLYVLECVDSTWISSKGHFIGDFESIFAHYTGNSHAVSVSNGTVALHLALVALGIGPGDEVIVPSLTYIASVNAIHYVGAVPVFADSLSDTWQLDPADVERKIGPKTCAIIAVHLYGGACEMDRISNLCKRYGLKLIEDCAEAIGTRITSKHVGTFGDIATFSFFGNKTITTGEGGMVVCDNAALDTKLRRLRGQGLAKDGEYWHDIIGYNYRMTNICAAIGLAQMERVDEILRGKLSLAARYRTALEGTPLKFQTTREGELSSHWMVTVLTPTPSDRDSLREELKAAGIETRPTFHPVHTMPMYRREGVRLPIAEGIAAHGINLPSWQRLSTEELGRIVSIIRGHRWETA